MSNSRPVIETFGLGKTYVRGRLKALSNLNISVNAAEIYGYLGPNGAGKSTTIKLLMDFIRPTAGHARILDLDSVTDSRQVKQSIGYLPGEFMFYHRLTGAEFLDYMSHLRPAKASYIKQLAASFEVPLDRKMADLSKGNRQKIGIIQAFMSKPAVLILDEPTGGLDPLMQEKFFELVREAKAGGATVFFSSHNLSEVQKVCDRVAFIKNGRLIAEQGIAELAESSVQTYDVSFAGPAPLAELKRLSGVKLTANSPHHVTIKVTGSLSPLLRLLAGHKVNSLDRREINLEDEFMKFYGGKR